MSIELLTVIFSVTFLVLVYSCLVLVTWTREDVTAVTARKVASNHITVALAFVLLGAAFATDWSALVFDFSVMMENR